MPTRDSPSPADRRAKPLRLPLLSAFAWLGAVCAAALVLTATLWRDDLSPAGETMLGLHYPAFMCQTFAYHAGIAMLPVALLAIITRRRRLLALAAAVFALGAAPDCFMLIPKRAPVASGASLRVMSVNVLYGGRRRDTLMEQIEREAPDVIVFQEWTSEGAARLRDKLRAAYPHSIEEPREDAFGEAIFSRRPFASEPRRYPPGPGFDVPQITVTVDLGGRPLSITNVHFFSPTSAARFGNQREMASSMARWVGNTRDDARPHLLIGDFNAVRRSSLLRTMLAAGMTSTHDQAGWWRGSTWPRVSTLRFMPGIRIDHALMRDELVCTESRTGEDFGSDHRPLIVTVGWR